MNAYRHDTLESLGERSGSRDSDTLVPPQRNRRKEEKSDTAASACNPRPRWAAPKLKSSKCTHDAYRSRRCLQIGPSGLGCLQLRQRFLHRPAVRQRCESSQTRSRESDQERTGGGVYSECEYCLHMNGSAVGDRRLGLLKTCTKIRASLHATLRLAVGLHRHLTVTVALLSRLELHVSAPNGSIRHIFASSDDLFGTLLTRSCREIPNGKSHKNRENLAMRKIPEPWALQVCAPLASPTPRP